MEDNRRKFYGVKIPNFNHLMYDQASNVYYDNQGNFYTKEQLDEMYLYVTQAGEEYGLSYDANTALYYDDLGNSYSLEQVEQMNQSSDYNTYMQTTEIPVVPVQQFYKVNEQNNSVEKEKKSKATTILATICGVLLFILLTGGGYLAWNKYHNSEIEVDLSQYEVNFITYGNEGEGKPEVDIKKTPQVKDENGEISEFLSKPDVFFDKKDNLKNGDKVEVTLELNKSTLKKHKLKAKGSFKKTFTVSGLAQKVKDKETVIVKEVPSSSSSSSSSGSYSDDERWLRILPEAGVNLRSEANDSSTILATARVGASVKQHGYIRNSSGEYWARVTFDGKTGWMRKDLIG